MIDNINVRDFRKTENEINYLILKRWSPRSFSSEKIDDKDLKSLFEAAKWAPSAYNNQPWRFIYVKNGGAKWKKMFSLLVDFNQAWVNKAAVLVLVISRQIFIHNNQANPTASFDAGSAWENLAIEAVNRGLIAHAMSGFDFEKAKKSFKIPDNYKVEVMIALGKQGSKSSLSLEMQEKEQPSDRKPLKEIISEGKFDFE